MTEKEVKRVNYIKNQLWKDGNQFHFYKAIDVVLGKIRLVDGIITDKIENFVLSGEVVEVKKEPITYHVDPVFPNSVIAKLSLDRIEDRMNKIEDERLKRPIGEYLGCDVLDKDWSDIDSMILEKSHNDGVLQKVKYFIAENRKSR